MESIKFKDRLENACHRRLSRWSTHKKKHALESKLQGEGSGSFILISICMLTGSYGTLLFLQQDHGPPQESPNKTIQ